MKKTFLILGLITLVCCSGCFRILIPVSTSWPKINYPGRPYIEIPEVDTEDPKVSPFIKSTYQYSRHIDVLEKVIETYNKEAGEHNKKVEEKLFDEKRSWFGR